MINWDQLLTGGGVPSPAAQPTPAAPLNPVGTATGGTGPFGITPYIPPDQRGAFQALADSTINKLTWSEPAGGYISNVDAMNANSWYNKFGTGSGGDPNANARAAQFYGALGALPTTANTSPALATLNQRAGIAPALGPSLSQLLGTPYQGPFKFGERMPGFNPYGQYQG